MRINRFTAAILETHSIAKCEMTLYPNSFFVIICSHCVQIPCLYYKMHNRERGGGYSVYFNKRCTFHLDEIKTHARVLYPGYELWVFDFLVGRSNRFE